VKPSALIDPADRMRLETAVIEAVRATAGELVVFVVHACDDYRSAAWRGGVLLAALAFLGLAVTHAALPHWAFLAAQALALALGHALCRIDAVRRRLVSESYRDARVAERARRAFAEAGLERTRGRTGILIFVALLERRVVVLADEGIHKALAPDEGWDEVARLAAEDLRRGRAVEGLAAAAARCGAILARHVPAPARAVGDLPSPVLLEE
jgi:putative membrane protein